MSLGESEEFNLHCRKWILRKRSEILRKKNNLLIYGRLFKLLWSRRDSNPRPNKQHIRFLHAYSVLGFRRKADNRQPTLRLTSKIFVIWPKFPNPYFRIAIPRNQTSRNRTSAGYLASLLYFEKTLNPTIIQIKLQEQTLGRQLKFCDKGLKRSRHGSLHAYLPIGLAVETSLPRIL